MLYLLHLQRVQIILLAVSGLIDGNFCHGKRPNWFSCTSLPEKRVESGWAPSTGSCNSLGAGVSELFVTVEHIIVHNAAETKSCDWKMFAFDWSVTVLPGNTQGLWIQSISGMSAYLYHLKAPGQNGLMKNMIRADNDLYKTVLWSMINNRGCILSCSKPSCLCWHCQSRCWSSDIHRNVTQEQLPLCLVAAEKLLWVGPESQASRRARKFISSTSLLGSWWEMFPTSKPSFRNAVEQAKQVRLDNVQGMLCRQLLPIISNSGAAYFLEFSSWTNY